MAQGSGDSIVLFDKDGNEITVTLRNGKYRLNVVSHEMVRLLQRMSTQLEEIQEILMEL